VTGLVDSGCSARAFVDRDFAKTHNITTKKTPKPRTLLLANGEVADTITEYFIAPVAVGLHEELCLFFLTKLSRDTPVIFGLPWLQRHNPTIDWTGMSLTFSSEYCAKYCCPRWLQTSPQAPVISDPPKSFHNLPIKGEPAKAQHQLPQIHVSFHDPPIEDLFRRPHASSTNANYRSPTVEETEGEEPQRAASSTNANYRPPTVEDTEDEEFLRTHDHAQEYHAQ